MLVLGTLTIVSLTSSHTPLFACSQNQRKRVFALLLLYCFTCVEVFDFDNALIGEFWLFDYWVLR
jgi:hypothetical protein